jgi:predicted ribosome quality control (RQC) complex YloA/Tae2 family protein
MENQRNEQPLPAVKAVFTAEVLAEAASEAAAILVGGRIEKIFRPSEREFIFKVRCERDDVFFLVSAERGLERFHLLTEPRDMPLKPDGFALELRKYLSGGRITAMEPVNGDRVLKIAVSQKSPELDPEYGIIIELLPSRGNIIVVDSRSHILMLLEKSHSGGRLLEKGRQYETPPPPPSHADSLNRIRQKPDGPNRTNRAVEEYFGAAASAAEENTLRAEYERAVKSARKRAGVRREKLLAALRETEKADELRECGELLKSRLDAVKRGADEAEVPDFFRDEGATRKIKLDPRLSALDNAGKYFKKYKKLKRGKVRIASELERANDELGMLDEAERALRSAGDIPELRRFGRKFRWLFPREKPAKGPSRMEGTGPRRFVSSDGFCLLVGRDDAENDELTIRMADGNDFFLHASGYPGSHVIIRTGGGKDVPPKTMFEAAQLAAHYSKAKNLGRVEISYTPRKFVSKPRGAKPGLVLLSRHRTFAVRPDPDVIRMLKEITERAPEEPDGDEGE